MTTYILVKLTYLDRFYLLLPYVYDSMSGSGRGFWAGMTCLWSLPGYVISQRGTDFVARFLMSVVGGRHYWFKSYVLEYVYTEIATNYIRTIS